MARMETSFTVANGEYSHSHYENSIDGFALYEEIISEGFYLGPDTSVTPFLK